MGNSKASSDETRRYSFKDGGGGKCRSYYIVRHHGVYLGIGKQLARDKKEDAGRNSRRDQHEYEYLEECPGNKALVRIKRIVRIPI